LSQAPRVPGRDAAPYAHSRYRFADQGPTRTDGRRTSRTKGACWLRYGHFSNRSCPRRFFETPRGDDWSGRLERFRAKWTPVRVKKTRQNKNLELRSGSIGTGKPLDRGAELALKAFVSTKSGNLVDCAAPDFTSFNPGYELPSVKPLT
jgi:hypothetical protein